MKVSLNWLSDLLGRQLEVDDVSHRLAMLGSPVEGVEALSPDLQDVIVAVVERVEPHPNADRLTLCHVHDGTEVREVVCGAPNVQAGRKYPYAPVGGTLPGGLKLSARKIRGVVSHGMLCSASELGLGSDHEGILELRTEAAAGTPFLDVMPIEDTRLDVEVTANRGDLLGHRGVARELSAVYGVPVKLPAIPQAREAATPRRVELKGAVGGVDVNIEDLDGCPRYMAAVIRGVQVGPSPAWLEARLRAIGARPINNVVDATNYILFELNQPLHAFDARRLRGDRVIVRRARRGERLTTLDGIDRALGVAMTMICDGDGPIAVGGVIGGANSEVTEATTDVLLECAYFDGRRIRNTRRALAISTDASYRFERGTDIDAMDEALRRAVILIRSVAGGDEPEGPIDVYPRPRPQRAVFVRPERVTQLLGTDISMREIEQHLSALGFVAAPKDGRLHVQVPAWRPDVAREVDLIEEIARLRGYDSFPLELRSFRPSSVPSDPDEIVRRRLRQLLTGMGLHEARSQPFVAPGHPDAARVVNPLSAEESCLRTDLMSGLAASVERNWGAMERGVRLFEIGHVFRSRGGEALPDERARVAGVVTGPRRPPHWTASGKAPDYDRWDARALAEGAMEVAVPGSRLEPRDDRWIVLARDGTERGWVGPVSADRPAWAAPLYGFEMDIVSGARPAVQYREVPAMPAVERDVALVLPDEVSALAVEQAIRSAAGALLESVHIFDEYRGAELAGRSVAWRLVLRAKDRTLRDEDADGVVTRVVAALKERFDVERR